jgi:hypothetical protein
MKTPGDSGRPKEQRNDVRVDRLGASIVLKRIGEVVGDKKPAIVSQDQESLTISRTAFDELQGLLLSLPELRDDPELRALRECDPDDPFDRCWLPR